MIYVNLHPTATYSIVTLAGGTFVDVRNYVKDVGWLMWEGRRQLRVFDDVDKQRIFCLIQRLEEAGAEVKIRNKRPDKEWNDPVYEHRTHEELIALEIAGKEEPNEIRWAKESIAKYTKQLNECEADEYKKIFGDLIAEEEERLALFQKSFQKEEAERIKRIREFWDEEEEEE